MRQFWVGGALAATVTLAGWLGFLPGESLHPTETAQHVRWSGDAALRSLWFVDDQEGWAVGDDGLILHTIDGGQSWERQASGTRANLRYVQFVTPFVGFAVGEEPLPELARTVGVVLTTHDGGTTWRRVSDRQMPGLYRIHFLDERRGVAVGDSCDAFPSGAWHTEDGGLSWRPIPGVRQPGWYTVAWVRPDFAIVAGRRGKLAMLHWPRSSTPAWQPILYQVPGSLDNLSRQAGDLPPLRGVCWTGQTGWACGDRGLLLVCRDPQGRRWEPVSLPVTPALLDDWDFHAVHFTGDFGWVAGRPGSVILHTWDGGKTWQVQRTPQNVPIHALYFVNERCGWAAGDGGTILHTRDGGKTWQLQRRGVHRASVLIVTARAETLPCELITSLAADEGYYTVAVRLIGEDSSLPDDAAAGSERFHTAVRRLGGVSGETLTGWQAPAHLETTSAEKLAEFLGSGNAARTMERLQRQLVLTLRIWRPDVVVTDHPDVQGPAGPAGALTTLAVGKAFRLASNADAFPDQIVRWQLEPWPAAKLYCVWDRGEGATVSADWHAIRPGLASSVWESALTARHLLAPLATFSRNAPAVSVARRLDYFRLLDSRIEGAEKHRWLLEGVYAPAGGPTRRQTTPVEWDEHQAQKVTRQTRKMEELLSLADRLLASPQTAERWLASVPQELSSLSESQAAEILWQLAAHLANRGQWGLAKTPLVWLLERHPDHPLAPASACWLVAFFSSGEARRRAELRQFVCDLLPHDSKLEPAAPKPAAKAAPRSDSDLSTILDRRRDDWRYWDRGAILAGDVLTAYGPLFWFDPRVQFCLLAVQRRLGRSVEALSGYTRLRLQWLAGPWYEAAASEIIFLQPAVAASRNKPEPAQPALARKPAYLCTWTNQPPYLDGELEDEVWQVTPVIPFRNILGQTSDAFPTQARLAYDERFFYVALRCNHPQGHKQEPVRPRHHDAVTTGFDRVSLLLDLDRDFVTCYHLQVDQRGCVSEECWTDRSWNPKWFVASKSMDTGWQAEIAIPWTELVREPPNSRQAWAFNLVRIIPNQGIQAVASPAGVLPRPEGMAILTFSEQR